MDKWVKRANYKWTNDIFNTEVVLPTNTWIIYVLTHCHNLPRSGQASKLISRSDHLIPSKSKIATTRPPKNKSWPLYVLLMKEFSSQSDRSVGVHEIKKNETGDF